MKRYLLLIFVELLCVASFAQSTGVDTKARKAIEKEENQYQKEQRRKPQSAEVYFEHANNLLGFNSESGRAQEFYELALKYDSANADIYKAYGKYLITRLNSLPDAKKNLERGLALRPTDAEIIKLLDATNKALAGQEEERKMKDYGTASRSVLYLDSNMLVCTKFDSLKEVSVAAGRFNYQTLLKKYLTDALALTPEEMYMLIVGYSNQKSYNPFNYNDISEVRALVAYNVDTAVAKGLRAVENNPLSPSLNREIMFCYRKKKDTVNADIFQNRIRQFFNGVLYSGNGTCKKPYVSLWAREEYNFISYIGYKSTEYHSMGTCNGQMAEVIDVINPNTQKGEQIHFNVALIYLQAVGK